jgi:hypothetical protein
MNRSIPLCHHLHSTGHRCGSPSLRNEQFCYHHHPTRPAVRRQRLVAQPGAQSVAFDLPPIIDRVTMHQVLCEIIMRLADGSLDPKRGGMLINCLQIAAANMQSGPRSGPYTNPGLDPSNLV